MGKSSIIPIIFIVALLFASCASKPVEAPGQDETLVLLYIEEIHKPISAPSGELMLLGEEDAFHFNVRSPVAILRVPSAPRHQTVGITINAGGDTLEIPMETEFAATGGTVVLLPVKAIVVSKTQVEIEPLSALDVQYAQSRLQSAEAFQSLPILYPDVDTD